MSADEGGQRPRPEFPPNVAYKAPSPGALLRSHQPVLLPASAAAAVRNPRAPTFFRDFIILCLLLVQCTPLLYNTAAAAAARTL